MAYSARMPHEGHHDDKTDASDVLFNDFQRELKQLLDEASLKQQTIQHTMPHSDRTGNRISSTPEKADHSAILHADEIRASLSQQRKTLHKLEMRIQQQEAPPEHQLKQRDQLQQLIHTSEDQLQWLASEKLAAEHEVQHLIATTIEKAYKTQIDSHQAHYSQFIEELSDIMTHMYKQLDDIPENCRALQSEHQTIVDLFYSQAQESYHQAERDFNTALIQFNKEVADIYQEIEQAHVLSDLSTCRKQYDTLKFRLDERYAGFRQSHSALKQNMLAELNQHEQQFHTSYIGLHQQLDEKIREAKNKLQQHSHRIYTQIKRETQGNISTALNHFDEQLEPLSPYVSKALRGKVEKVKRHLERKGREYHDLRMKQYKAVITEHRKKVSRLEQNQRDRVMSVKEEVTPLIHTTRNHINALHLQETERAKVLQSRQEAAILSDLDEIKHELHQSEQHGSADRQDAYKRLQEERVHIGRSSKEQLSHTSEQKQQVVRDMRIRLSELNHTMTEETDKLKEERLQLQKQLKQQEQMIYQAYQDRITKLNEDIAVQMEAADMEHRSRTQALEARYARMDREKARIHTLKRYIESLDYNDTQYYEFTQMLTQAEAGQSSLTHMLEDIAARAETQYQADKHQIEAELEQQRARLDVDFQAQKERHRTLLKEKLDAVEEKQQRIQSLYQKQMEEARSENDAQMDALRSKTQHIEHAKRDALNELQQAYHDHSLGTSE